MKYADKLKDPRWQRKRLEILSRDEFKCVWCGNGKQTLHIHHHFYNPNGNPWDVPDCELITLCEDCHWLKHNKDVPEEIHTVIYCFVVAGKFQDAIRFLTYVFRELYKEKRNGE